MIETLPIHDVLDPLIDSLRASGRAVLQAPPGAGKTTVVPLAILQAKVSDGLIVMLEPRRLAARAAAERMAQTLGEQIGDTVGYRIRGEAKVSNKTRIVVVTEGILTRMIQSDPELSRVGTVIFDEFHERSLNADLGLALCLEITDALREDLKLLVMSATLDAEPVARLLGDAPVIASDGRSFPVQTQWLERPSRKETRFENAVADLVHRAVHETEGGILVFLPGEGEIRRVEALLKGRLPNEVALRPLFGAMDFAAQRAAITPAQSGRKVVLATSIAETSLTIQDIRVVVDGGKSRRARFDPASGMSRLVTESVTRAEATQRAGRAGRVVEGTCYRLWSKGEEGALQAFPPAEIETADLAGLALELAAWGAGPEELAFLTPPNPGSYAEAQDLLRHLNALDVDGRITEHGKVLSALPLHPRLGHMLVVAGPEAAPLAALLADRDPLGRGAPVDLALRLLAVRDFRGFSDRHSYLANRGGVERIKQEAKRLVKQSKSAVKQELSDAEMAALAYPDRIGLRRKGDAPRYVMSGGKGAIIPDGDPLCGARLIVVTELDGNVREARIRQAIQISESEVRSLFGEQIVWNEVCEWSKRDRQVIARKQEALGAVVLADQHWRDVPSDVMAQSMLAGVKELGLSWSAAAERFAKRVELVREGGEDLPEMTEAALLETLEDWLLPYLEGVKTAQDWKRFDMLEALRGRLSWEQMQRLDQAAPAHFTTPLGRKIPIEYGGVDPEISLRLQEMFGQTTHPVVGKTPLRVTLLSPAGRPVQTTMDIPGFWASSYADVRKDMRGRYPKHPWPEDPTHADPTLRAKRRR
ncbi:ATP-dependent RNA helicase HrpB [Roseovarius albus]|uniref:ATP-dependent RNA helicase HrpB n=1 Tax=Roseovarius albus TaxID=1247867 RepID=A0A1X6YLS3_9RHOB|nr:ATP-dependent helicase HrpB [Roseovarius albus]SLN24569.1 ATP-dependent RNA helicase HrpB [Roseovarius albus]